MDSGSHGNGSGLGSAQDEATRADQTDRDGAECEGERVLHAAGLRGERAAVRREGGDEHGEGERDRDRADEESGDEREAADELRPAGRDGRQRREGHAKALHEAGGTLDAVAAEDAEQLLGAVEEEDGGERETQDEDAEILAGVHDGSP